jgi:hypothetical protein
MSDGVRFYAAADAQSAAQRGGGALQAHSRGIRTISASNVYAGDEPGMDETDVAESYR